MNESVIHLYTTPDLIGSYAGVWLDILDKSDPLHGAAPPFKIFEFELVVETTVSHQNCIHSKPILLFGLKASIFFYERLKFA